MLQLLCHETIMDDSTLIRPGEIWFKGAVFMAIINSHGPPLFMFEQVVAILRSQRARHWLHHRTGNIYYICPTRGPGVVEYHHQDTAYMFCSRWNYEFIQLPPPLFL